MEQAEATDVESVILWRVQRILESLLPGELDAWLHRAGLAGAIGQLKCEVERMETVVNGVKGRAVGNKPLARCLARVKELMHDANVVVDELDYCRLQDQVEVNLAPVTEPEGMVLGDGGATDGSEEANASASSTAGISDNKCRKNRSKERDYFHITPAVDGEPARAKCIDCGTQVIFSHGTSVLRKHRNSGSCKKKRAATEETPNRPSAGDGVQNRAAVSANDSEGRKRTGIEGNVAATVTPHWDHAKFSKRIDEITRELGTARVSAIDYLKDSVANLFNKGKNSLGYGCGLTGDDNAILEPAMADPPGVAAADAGPYLNTSETSAAVVQLQPSADAARRKRKRKRLRLRQQEERLVQRLMKHQESLHRQFVEAMERRERERAERDEAWRRQEADKFAREADLQKMKISGVYITFPPSPPAATASGDDTNQEATAAGNRKELVPYDGGDATAPEGGSESTAGTHSPSSTLETVPAFSHQQNFPDTNISALSPSSGSSMHGMSGQLPSEAASSLPCVAINTPVSVSDPWPSKRVAVESVNPSRPHGVSPQIEQLDMPSCNVPQNSALAPLPGRECLVDQDGSSDPQNHLLFCVNIDSQSLLMQGGISSLQNDDSSGTIPSQNDFPLNQPLHSGGCLDESGYVPCAENSEQANQQFATFVKVYKSGTVGRLLDITRVSSYNELRSELGRQFGLEGQLEDPLRSCWQLVYVDRENDVLLVGDDPWQEFVNSVSCIKILSSAQWRFSGWAFERGSFKKAEQWLRQLREHAGIEKPEHWDGAGGFGRVLKTGKPHSPRL